MVARSPTRCVVSEMTRFTILLTCVSVIGCASSRIPVTVNDGYYGCVDSRDCSPDTPECRVVGIEGTANICTSLCEDGCFQPVGPAGGLDVVAICLPVDADGTPDSNGTTRICLPQCSGGSCILGSHCETMSTSDPELLSQLIGHSDIDICVPDAD